MDFIDDINEEWTLFLDRDGVINIEKDQDYIRNVNEFIFYDDILSHFPILNKTFGRIIVVTNQRGIGKNLMTHDDLHGIHQHIIDELKKVKATIHRFYYAPDLETDAEDRKPNIGMGLKAKKDFPEIDFRKSVMVGNNISDVEFGHRLGMKTVYVNTTKPRTEGHPSIDLMLDSLPTFCKMIEK